MKTGPPPFISKLKLFTKCGIAFDKGVFTVPDKATRTVYYACKNTILAAVDKAFPDNRPPEEPSDKAQGGNVTVGEVMDRRHTPVRTAA